MPFTEDFKKVRNKFDRLYPENKAKAETFAFKEAFKLNIQTFRDKQTKFKTQKSKDMFGF